MRRLKELLWHQMDAREYARESDLHKCQGMLLHRVGLIHGRHDRVMIVLEYNVDKRNGTSIYYSQRVIPILVCWSKLLHSIPFAWSSDCLRSTRTLYSVLSFAAVGDGAIDGSKAFKNTACNASCSSQIFLRGTVYNFQGALCIPSHLLSCVISMVIRWT
nr:hypothetical protein CFP56_40120 [Quercus suber]